MKSTIISLSLTLAAVCGSFGFVSAQTKPCTPSGGLNFICGVQAAEDLVVVPNTRWLIASGMSAGSGLHLVDTTAKTAQTLFGPGVTANREEKTKFASCPGPLDPKLAVLHGLSLRPAQSGRYTLYATNHGGRESVEVFEVDARNATPSATWTGCLLLPDKLAVNSVAAFNDGALVATVLTLPDKTFEDVWAGRNTGVVLMWTPQTGKFQALAGTELPGNNGIETSADNREFFVVSTGLKRIVTYSRANPSKPVRIAQLKEFAPDNVRMVGDRLVTVGMIDDEKACGGAPKKPEDIQCPRGWIADSIDPKTMAITEIARGPAAPPYTGSATAIPIGNTLWLSSFTADRIAYRALK
jgi:hypothetical protein